MVDFPLVHRPALANAKTGMFGERSAPNRIALTALPEGHVLQVLSRRGASGVEDLLPQIGDASPCAVRAVGPGQWFVAGDAVLSRQDMASKAALLSGKASIADQSHGRVRIGIRGTAVEAVLAKGTAVDLHPAQFAASRSAMTLIGHISALVTRIGENSFEILVLRGFAESLWDDLIRMSLEFGVDARTGGTANGVENSLN